jgi:PPOX class probable F420-dependent enzyme
VLGTRHDDRGVDAVPVVFVLVGGSVVVPIDTVKPKRHTRLQRIANIEADPRCVLLVDQYDDDDWDRLWWVRLHAMAAVIDPTEEHIGALAARYSQYGTPGMVVGAILLSPASISGWSAAPG